MLIDLEPLLNHLEWAAEKGHLDTCYNEYFLKTQIAIAERLEKIAKELEIANLAKAA